MWSWNHAFRKLREPALGKAIPSAKLPEFRTREVTPFVLIFLLQANKADTHVLWFSKKEKNLVFVVINFLTSLKFENLTLVKTKKMCFESLKKYKKKFFILLLSRNRIVYFWIKKMRKWMSYSFSSKKIIYFENGKKMSCLE